MRTSGANSLFLVAATTLILAPAIQAQEEILTAEYRELPNGSSELAITNNREKQMVTAFILFRPSSNPQVYRSAPDYHDILFTPEQHDYSDAIMPLETRRFRTPPPSEKVKNESEKPKNEVEELKAAVFSDGTTWGDPEWVQRILECRRAYYTDLGVAIRKIRQALEEDTPIEQLRKEFEQLQDSAPRPGDDFEHFGEFKAARDIYGNILAHLPRASVAGQDDPSSILARFLPMLATRQMVIGQSKPSIVPSSE
jgi:hypothetical protein